MHKLFLFCLRHPSWCPPSSKSGTQFNRTSNEDSQAYIQYTPIYCYCCTCTLKWQMPFIYKVETVGISLNINKGTNWVQ